MRYLPALLLLHSLAASAQALVEGAPQSLPSLEGEDVTASSFTATVSSGDVAFQAAELAEICMKDGSSSNHCLHGESGFIYSDSYMDIPLVRSTYVQTEVARFSAASLSTCDDTNRGDMRRSSVDGKTYVCAGVTYSWMRVNVSKDVTVELDFTPIGAHSCQVLTETPAELAGIPASGTVTCTLQDEVPESLFIGGCRMADVGTVEVKFCNNSGFGSSDPDPSDFLISVSF